MHIHLLSTTLSLPKPRLLDLLMAKSSTPVTSIAAHLLAKSGGRSAALANEAAMAKRISGQLRKELKEVGPCLTAAERVALEQAAQVMDNIRSASQTAKLQARVREQEIAHRRRAASAAVRAAFADVKDPAGVVVLLATGGSWRTYQSADGSRYLSLKLDAIDAFDALSIMDGERTDALEYYAWKIATESMADVAEQVALVRSRFDEQRAAIEARHQPFIQVLTAQWPGPAAR